MAGSVDPEQQLSFHCGTCQSFSRDAHLVSYPASHPNISRHLMIDWKPFAYGMRAVASRFACPLFHAWNKQIIYKRTPPLHKSRLIRHNPVVCLLRHIRVGSTTTASLARGLWGILCGFLFAVRRKTDTNAGKPINRRASSDFQTHTKRDSDIAKGV